MVFVFAIIRPSSLLYYAQHTHNIQYTIIPYTPLCRRCQRTASGIKHTRGVRIAPSSRCTHHVAMWPPRNTNALTHQHRETHINTRAQPNLQSELCNIWCMRYYFYDRQEVFGSPSISTWRLCTLSGLRAVRGALLLSWCRVCMCILCECVFMSASTWPSPSDSWYVGPWSTTSIAPWVGETALLLAQLQCSHVRGIKGSSHWSLFIKKTHTNTHS